MQRNMVCDHTDRQWSDWIGRHLWIVDVLMAILMILICIWPRISSN